MYPLHTFPYSFSFCPHILFLIDTTTYLGDNGKQRAHLNLENRGQFFLQRSYHQIYHYNTGAPQGNGSVTQD